jgi:hypothetical protein
MDAVRVAKLVVLLPLLAACRREGSPSEARITTDGHVAEVELAGHRARLPPGDVLAEPPAVEQDATGKRLSYRTSSGRARILYRVGDGVFVGPLTAYPADFAGVPPTEHALGPLFEMAGSRRGELIGEVRRAMGDEAVARLLAVDAYVDDPAWEEAKRALPAEVQRRLGNALVTGLQAGRPPVMLRRAVESVDLHAPWIASLVDARLLDREAAVSAPRAFAVLLRSVITSDRKQAGASACQLLREPLDTSGTSGDGAVLLEAATLAVAAADVECPPARLEDPLLSDVCAPFYRCREARPIGREDASAKDEPLCTTQELARAVADEVERRPVDVLHERSARPGLFALAWLSSKNLVPASFVRAQEEQAHVRNCDLRPTHATP